MSRPSVSDSQLTAVWASIERLQRVAGRIDERIGDELDLTEVAARALLAVAEGCRTVSAVADRCGRHVSTASRLVDVLVQRDLVLREEDTEDRRAVRLTLTPAGEDAAARIRHVSLDLLTASLADLDPADVDELARLLDQLAAAVEQRSPALDD